AVGRQALLPHQPGSRPNPASDCECGFLRGGAAGRSSTCQRGRAPGAAPSSSRPCQSGVIMGYAITQGVQANTTADIYRNGHSPPAAPDVAGVPVLLLPAYQDARTHVSVVTSGSTDRWTHLLLVDLDVD